jgi:hypothetical protein
LSIPTLESTFLIITDAVLATIQPTKRITIALIKLEVNVLNCSISFEKEGNNLSKKKKESRIIFI